MPIQQSIDVALPVTEVFNHWTEYEDWPEFMHRIESAEQVDETTVSFQAKIWGISKRFEAEIVEQRPDERIEWNVTEGYAHTGVVTFHQLVGEPDPDRPLARHPAGEPHRQGQPRNAVRKARGAR